MYQGSCLVLAPHLEYPTRNGADILVDRTAAELSQRFSRVDVLAADGFRVFENGETTIVDERPFGPRSRTVAGLRTVFLGSHYYTEKFLTSAYRRQARQLLADRSYDLVMSSYMTTAAWAQEADQHSETRCHAAWTHNDEFKWFEDLEQSSRSFAGRRAARSSLGRLRELCDRRSRDLVFVQVSDEDRRGYEIRCPDMRSVVAPIGVDLPERPTAPTPAQTEDVSLLFVGSLGVRMNLDALTHFQTAFWPGLREAFGDAVSLTVAGSNPSQAVERLCANADWSLKPNVSDAELQSLYEGAAFAVLPFEYATGAKLKLLGALSHGVPVLATEHVAVDSSWEDETILFSSDPGEWLRHIRQVLGRGISNDDRTRLQDIARAFSWAASTEKLLVGLRETGCIQAVDERMSS